MLILLGSCYNKNLIKVVLTFNGINYFSHMYRVIKNHRLLVVIFKTQTRVKGRPEVVGAFTYCFCIYFLREHKYIMGENRKRQCFHSPPSTVKKKQKKPKNLTSFFTDFMSSCLTL
jgi:hypothetical protein